MTHPEVRFLVTQDGDCCDRASTQQLVVTTQCGSHDPTDYFCVLETQRWAFNTREDLIEMLEEVLCRIHDAMRGLTNPIPHDPDRLKEGN